MSSASLLTTAEISHIFAEEIAACGGAVTDVYQDGGRLFARSLLPYVEDVRTQDRLQGGVAIKADGGQTQVRPYVFRKVCSNGAIMARTLDAPRCAEMDFGSELHAELALREEIRACVAPHVFASTVQMIRATVDAPFDMALNFLPYLSRWPVDTVREIMGRFLDAEDDSQFGLMNAVTSVARDTSDPDLRWRLEELGGGVAAGLTPKKPLDQLSAQADSRRAVAVG